MLQGGLEAFAFPSLNHMSCQWVPEKEKSAFLSFAFVGGTFGSIITNPMCGAIIASLGWEVSLIHLQLANHSTSLLQAVFYVTGGISLAWCFVWMILARDSPDDSNLISEGEVKLFKIVIKVLLCQEERKYIIATRTFTNTKTEDDVPFVALLM